MQTYTVNTRMSKCEVPIGMLALECDLCHSLVALFDPNKVRIPLHATMFESLTMVRGGPPPFQLAAKRLGDNNWKLCQCRACNNFVFLDRKTRRCKTSLSTPFGVWEIGSRVVPHKITQAELNQQKIDEAFKEEEERLSVEEANQKEIEKLLKDEYPVTITPEIAQKIQPLKSFEGGKIKFPIEFGKVDRVPTANLGDTQIGKDGIKRVYVKAGTDIEIGDAVALSEDGTVKKIVIPKETHCRYCNKYYNSTFWLDKHEKKCKNIS